MYPQLSFLKFNSYSNIVKLSEDTWNEWGFEELSKNSPHLTVHVAAFLPFEVQTPPLLESSPWCFISPEDEVLAA